MIAIIAAYSGEKKVIGKNGKIPWNIPQDMELFKNLTTGNTVIFGRKTFEEIKKPLSNRYNIIVSKKRLFFADNCITVPTLKEALEKAKTKNNKNIFICGGISLYKEALPIADTLYLTEIKEEYNGDTYFPEINFSQFTLNEKKELSPKAVFYTYTRKS